jgi:ABC-type branched-subunit amino acid transport system substrate-binding protein
MKIANWALLLSALVIASAAVRAEDIVVSQVSTFSGSQAVTGKAMHAGAKLYLDYVNSQGGIKGRRIRLETHDDAGKPEDTVRLIRESIAQEDPWRFY